MVRRRRNCLQFYAQFLLMSMSFTGMPSYSSADGPGPLAGPSSNALFELQRDNRGHPWLHITADSVMVERKVLQIDDTGLHGLSAPHGARVAPSLTWNRIQRIDEVVTRAGSLRRVGAVSAGLLGLAIGTDQGAGVALAGMAVLGGAGGFVGDRIGSRFRSERNWYVADTARRAPEVTTETPVSSAVPGADPAVLQACKRIGRNQLFRAYGQFGSFRGRAGIVGPEALEDLRSDRHGSRHRSDAPIQRITWDQVDQIDMRGGSALQGAVVGGAAFATVGALAAMAAVALSEGSDVGVGEAGVVGALLVAPVGIVFGGLGGMAFRHWVVVYRRD